MGTHEIIGLLNESSVKSEGTHDILLDSLYEKNFTTFLQVLSEIKEEHNDALGVCDLFTHTHSASVVVSCKEKITARYDGYEREYIEILNKLCGR